MTHPLSMDEIRRLPPEELTKTREETVHILAHLRIGIALRKEKDTARLRRERRLLARLSTAVRERKKK